MGEFESSNQNTPVQKGLLAQELEKESRGINMLFFRKYLALFLFDCGAALELLGTRGWEKKKTAKELSEERERLKAAFNVDKESSKR